VARGRLSPASDAVRRARAELAQRLERWRRTALPIAHAAVAAGLSWLIAVNVGGHPAPFFAPIAAVICLGVTLGQRLRRAIELVAGVGVGIGIGDLLLATIGTGPWQIGLAVALAMSAAALLDSGVIIAVQAAASAVLVATLYLPEHASGVSRMVDALIGGATGLVVAAMLPGNPVTVVRSKATRVLGQLAGALHGVASAIKERDADKAAAVLERARDTQRLVDDFRTALQVGEEITTIAPMHWRRRPALQRYVTLMTPADHALRNTRVMIRRAVTALRDGEPMPDTLCGAIDDLAAAVELLGAELADGKDPAASRGRMQTVAAAASPALIHDDAFSTRVVLAQLRSTAVDMLQGAGMSRDEALASLPAVSSSATRAPAASSMTR
jgi:uncharacterized membrane protein YgaE (UPF0421/DUF939 family)